jgi:hypothetical protein
VITDLEKRQNFGYGGGIYLLGGRVENTVFWGNTSERAGYTGDPEWYGATKTVFLKCALPAGVTTNATTGSDFLMLADPRFRDAAGGDFQIRGASPLVNAGANQNIAAEDLDLDRQPRIFNFGGRNGLVDIGCYESQVRAGILFLVR